MPINKNKVREEEIMASNDLNEPPIIDAIELMGRTNTDLSRRTEDYERIKELYLDGSYVVEPVGLDRVGAQLLYQMVEKIFSRLTRPGYQVRSNDLNVNENIQLRASLDYILDEGGFLAALTQKPAAYRYMLLYGDAFIRIGYEEGKRPVPFSFDLIEPTNVYVNPGAFKIRSKIGTQSVNEMVIVYTYDIYSARNQYPGVDIGVGRVPRYRSREKGFNESFRQQQTHEKDLVEIAHYFDLRDYKKPEYTIFAGSKGTILRRYIGEKYPYWWTRGEGKEPYIPVIQMTYQEDLEGFFNLGMGHYLYRPSKTHGALLNHVLNQQMTSLTPLMALNIADEQQIESVTENIMAGMDEVAQGRPGIVPIPSRNAFNVAPLQAPFIDTAKVNGLGIIEENSLLKGGINPSEIDIDRAKTATQTRAEVAAQSKNISKIVDGMTQPMEEVLEMVYTMIRDAPKSDLKDVYIPNVELKRTAMIRDENGRAQVAQMFGADGQELTIERDVSLATVQKSARRRNSRVNFDIDTRTGDTEKDTMRIQDITVALQATGTNPIVSGILSSELIKLLNITIPKQVERQLLTGGQPQPTQTSLRTTAEVFQPQTGNIEV